MRGRASKMEVYREQVMSRGNGGPLWPTAFETNRPPTDTFFFSIEVHYDKRGASGLERKVQSLVIQHSKTVPLLYSKLTLNHCPFHTDST